ncbi:putative DNA primase/helicase [Methylobacterium sp. ap11]|uniref:hypothetical protein n=1 Tax=Methylobacterium sp. ap11 TaxID=1761799 RepID=UPI0008BC0802|nr:hypothetical protein [Methylobacterium sp. ap11]SEO42289.1 putative DNA primase/helicase [Methylobacterium sp. ap11]
MNMPIDLAAARRAKRRQDRAVRVSGSVPGGPGKPRSQLPIIKVVASEMPRVVDEAEEILIESGTPVFSRAGGLVQPVTEMIPAAEGRLTLIARLKALGPDALTDLLARVVKFQRYDERRRGWVNIDPPAKVAATLLAREGHWRLPPVAGIITTPTLRPDGSLLSEAGYDAATRLYLMSDGAMVLPEIPETPSRAEAEAALALLLGTLAEFPFVGPVDRAVALSGILTAVIRPALPVAPLHGIRASTAGTGKSLLVDLFAAIATGRPCSVMAVGKSEEETDKRLGALLLDGAPVLSLDNVTGELGGDMLCQVTERPLVRVRILGESKAPEIECRATIFATGNNLTLVGDMTRRAVLCTLDAGVERPEQREFATNPLEVIMADRGAYVAAAITIVRAYRAAGSPRVCGPIGSYGVWSDMVRSALIWLDEADPVSSMDVMRDEDPDRAQLSELIAVWAEHLAEGSFFTATEIDQVSRETDEMSTEPTHVSLREFLMRYFAKGPVVSTKSFGRYLASVRGRVINGRRLEMLADNKRGNRYALTRVDPLGRGV